MRKNWKRKIPLVILMATLGFVAFSGLVMLLWNNVLAAVLHVSIITFWQAAGIFLLAKLLFGGFRGRRHMMGGRCGETHMHVKWQGKCDFEPKVAGQE